MLLIIFLAILSAVAFYFNVIKKYNYWRDLGVPHVRPMYFFGNLAPNVFRTKSMPQIIKDVYNKFPKSRYVGFYNASEPILILRDPELIKNVTIRDFDSFPNHKQIMPYNVDVLWGKNLFQMSTEDGWHSMRSTLSPSFTSSKMKYMFKLMQVCATQFVNYFKTENGEVALEAKDSFTRFANDIIATCAFGVQCNSLVDRNNEFYVMGKEVTDFTGFKALKMFGYEISSTLMRLLNVKMFSNNVASFFRKIVRETIHYRKQNNVVRPDMIHLLLEASKKLQNPSETAKSKSDGSELSHDDITAQALIFFFAGFETISSAMCYLCYELAIHPEIQQRLYNELKETLKTSPQLAYENIASMKYLDSVISESLRLHTLAPFLDRKCHKSYTIEAANQSEKSLHIRKGQTVWVPVGAIHHDEQYHPNPLKFDPERFNAENRYKINTSTYLPFGSGPRNCIGKTKLDSLVQELNTRIVLGSRFALLELKLLTVEILRNFEIVPNNKTQIPLKNNTSSLNGLPDDGLFMSFKSRALSL
ncbi:hypothetical protein FQA39_LY15384 [Lamprigera yunnana]|nr:hypothetical protein FQA39_LY15384 [Lamprigera yunnana]